MRPLVLLGPPTAGKSTIASRLADALGWAQVNVGELLRGRAAEDAALAATLARGGRVDDGAVATIVEARLGRDAACVLEGFPRSVEQLASFDAWRCTHAAAFLLLDLDPSTVPARFMARRTCPACRRAQYAPGPCETCGGPLSARGDRSPEALGAKLRAWDCGERPMAARLAATGRLARIAVAGAPERDFGAVLAHVRTAQGRRAP